uniref:RING-type domain-containing protein n=1 Tax=Oryza punctata TaxID=4537 RepID=A0A0E0JFI3_ORYPU
MGNNDDHDATSKAGLHEQTTGCLPVDQSCFALSRLSYRRSSSGSGSNPRACCSTTSYLEVLAISLASLLVIVLVLCVIRCYRMHRAVNRVTVAASAAAAAAAAAATGNVTKKRPVPGLGEDAIAALPKFEYRGTGDECDRWECSICLCAVADGEVARQLPRCMHLFHRGCVDMWLVAHTTCPVCRAEVVVNKPPDGDDGRSTPWRDVFGVMATVAVDGVEAVSALIGEYYDGLALEIVVFSLAVVVLRYAAVLYANHLVDSLSELHAAVGAGISGGGGSSSGGGLDSAAIARLPCFVLSISRGGSVAECAVCLGTVEEGETVRALPCCPHAFHARCVDAWLRLRPTCPLCRAGVPVPATAARPTPPRARHAIGTSRVLGLFLLIKIPLSFAALTFGVLAASLFLRWRCRRAIAHRQQPTSVVASQLSPAIVASNSELPFQGPKKSARCYSGNVFRRALLRLLLCSRRCLTRVEPADSAAATQGEEGEQAAGPEEEVALWRDRWFGPTTAAALCALYTIDKESGAGSESEEEHEPELETPFYTPPASPPWLGSSSHSPQTRTQTQSKRLSPPLAPAANCKHPPSCFAFTTPNSWLFADNSKYSTRARLLFMGLSFTIGILSFLIYLAIWYTCTRRRRSRRGGGGVASADHEAPVANNHGMSAAAIAALPTFGYEAPAAAAAALDCAVCLGQVDAGEKVRQLPKCGHLFHAECVDAWLRAHSTCPMCRAAVEGPATAAIAKKTSSGGATDTPPVVATPAAAEALPLPPV